MRKHIFLGGAALALSTLVAAPIAAQQNEESSTRQVLGRVLQAILGPEEEEETDDTEQQESKETKS